MMWYLLSMIMGALVFSGGMVFEKLLNCESQSKKEMMSADELDPKLYYQWENLLGYDGTKQEEIDYENR